LIRWRLEISKGKKKRQRKGWYPVEEKLDNAVMD
jgi:hypothetical protein